VRCAVHHLDRVTRHHHSAGPPDVSRTAFCRACRSRTYRDRPPWSRPPRVTACPSSCPTWASSCIRSRTPGSRPSRCWQSLESAHWRPSGTARRRPARLRNVTACGATAAPDPPRSERTSGSKPIRPSAIQIWAFCAPVSPVAREIAGLAMVGPATTSWPCPGIRRLPCPAERTTAAPPAAPMSV
jgi:hypothetical protein